MSYPPGPDAGSYYAPPIPTAPARPRSSWRLAVIIGAIFLVLGTVIAVGLTAYIANHRQQISGNGFEVTVMSCHVDDGGWLPMAKVTYTVKNAAATARPATIRIEYRDGGGVLLDTDTAVTGPVPAGDTIRGEESTQLNAAGPLGRCKLVGVS